MGHDSIELIMDVEETFQISIRDAEAEEIWTVGDLYRYVAQETNVGPTASGGGPAVACLSARVFYTLRRAVLAIHPAGPDRLSPKTPFAQAVPLAERRAAWRQIAAATGLRLPKLHMSFRTFALFIGLAVVLSVAAGILLGSVAIALLGVFLGFVLFAVVNGKGRHLDGCTTLGDLARLTLYRNFAALAAQGGLDPQRELRQAVRRVVADCLGVPVADVRDDTRFDEDLGLCE